MTEARVIVFDVETTGKDPQRDQIVELCVQFGLEDGAPTKTWRIKPEVPMTPGAQAVHGISSEDLADCPPFVSVADEVRALFDEADVLVGYNLRFDIDALQAEYSRLKQPALAIEDKQIVDAFRLWQQCERRSLMDAHLRFVGTEFEAAHSAGADVAATGRVLGGMLEHFSLAADWNALATLCEPERARWIGGSRHIQRDEAGSIVIGFGKHAGAPLTELAAGPDASYLRWIADKDFPGHVLEIVNQALRSTSEAFVAWAEQKFPPPADDATSAPVERAAQATAPQAKAAGKNEAASKGKEASKNEARSPKKQAEPSATTAKPPPSKADAAQQSLFSK